MTEIQIRAGRTTEHAFARIETAWQALTEARTVPDVAAVLRGADALQQYIRRSKLGLRALNETAVLKVEATAKAGELLARPDERQGRGRPGKNRENVG